MPVSANTPDPANGFNPVAGIAAIIFPGAGHLARGQTDRGIKIAVGILGLFFGGILIGGIDVIDSKEDRVWFYGQALVGPIALGMDFVHQNYFKVRLFNERTLPDGRRERIQIGTRSAEPGEIRNPFTGEPALIVTNPETGQPRATATDPATRRQIVIEPARPPNIKSLSKVNELGTLFATVAGMLNVIVIVDAAFPSRRRQVRQVGLQATLADSQAPLAAPAVGDDPLGGATPGATK